MTTTTLEMPTITDEMKRQYRDEGYFLLERIIPAAHLSLLQEECDRYLALEDEALAAKGIQTNGGTHRGKRYFIGNKSKESAKLRTFLFSDLMAHICRATIGPDAFLFCEQFVVKYGEPESTFSWHQDSGYVGHEHRPYLTCWIALDDVTIENGTVFILPYARAGTRDIIRHEHDKVSNDLIGYHGEDPGIPVEVPAGSIAVFSSRVFHRSTANTTPKIRRAYVPQYSPEVILTSDGTRAWNMGVPFLKDGKIVTEAQQKD